MHDGVSNLAFWWYHYSTNSPKLQGLLPTFPAPSPCFSTDDLRSCKNLPKALLKGSREARPCRYSFFLSGKAPSSVETAGVSDCASATVAWQLPPIGQEPQEPPQEHFPCRLSRRMARTASTTTSSRPAQMRIVGPYAANHWNIETPPFRMNGHAQSDDFGDPICFLRAAGFGRNRKNTSTASTSTAAMKPGRLPFPVKKEPN